MSSSIGGNIIRISVAAKLCGVSPNTMRRAIDSGEVLGFRVPGSGGHRRVYAESLVAFMKRHGMQIPDSFRVYDTQREDQQ